MWVFVVISLYLVGMQRDGYFRIERVFCRGFIHLRDNGEVFEWSLKLSAPYPYAWLVLCYFGTCMRVRSV